jgi:hypothetical protein
VTSRLRISNLDMRSGGRGLDQNVRGQPRPGVTANRRRSIVDRTGTDPHLEILKLSSDVVRVQPAAVQSPRHRGRQMRQSEWRDM